MEKVKAKKGRKRAKDGKGAKRVKTERQGENVKGRMGKTVKWRAKIEDMNLRRQEGMEQKNT